MEGLISGGLMEGFDIHKRCHSSDGILAPTFRTDGWNSNNGRWEEHVLLKQCVKGGLPNFLAIVSTLCGRSTLQDQPLQESKQKIQKGKEPSIEMPLSRSCFCVFFGYLCR